MSRDRWQGSLKKITAKHSTGARGRVSCVVSTTKEIGHKESESDKIFRLRLLILVLLTVRLLPKTSDSDSATLVIASINLQCATKKMVSKEVMKKKYKNELKNQSLL